MSGPQSLRACACGVGEYVHLERNLAKVECEPANLSTPEGHIAIIELDAVQRQQMSPVQQG
jgi:hypothetical protein